jgi:hypothetical protein
MSVSSGENTVCGLPVSFPHADGYFLLQIADAELGTFAIA